MKSEMMAGANVFHESVRPSKLLALVLAGLLLFLVGGCSTPSIKVDPTLLHSSYDYTRPPEIADKSKPVWVLPIINKGWVPAKVDAQSGDWISGHYTASVIQDGHWATLEEAELAGAPYVVAGESKPVVPVPDLSQNPPQEVPSTRINGGEIEVAALDQRISALEGKEGSNQTEKTEELSGLSTQIQTLAQTSQASTQVVVPPSNSLNGYQPQIRAEAKPEMDKFSPGTSLFLPGSSLAGDYEIPVGSIHDAPTANIRVHYLAHNQVQVFYHGKVYQVQLKNPDDRIKLTLPQRAP